MKKNSNKQNIVLFCTICAIVLLDQLFKIFLTNVEANLIGSFLQISYTQNTGAAFSMLSGKIWLFILITIAFIGVLITLYVVNKNKKTIYVLATSFLVGGAIGNLIDRVFLGFVRDFIYINFFPAIFNFADIFITVGTVLLIVYILFYFGKETKNGK